MTIQKTQPSDLPKLAECAREFYAASEVLQNFDMARFQAVWTGLIESGAGVIFSLIDDAGEILGTIGGLAYPDLYSGELIATEFFWFVRDGHRGGGLKLYRAFESWGREQACTQIRMVHLIDSMPEKLARVYRHLGFVPVETHYSKPLDSTKVN